MTTEEMLKLEKAALERIKAIRLEKGMSEKALGELAFTDSKAPAMKISKFYNGSANNGKEKRVTLADFVALCGALGVKPEHELKKVLTEE